MNSYLKTKAVFYFVNKNTIIIENVKYIFKKWKGKK